MMTSHFASASNSFIPCSKFFPRSFSHSLLRPRKTILAVGNAPMSVRFSPFLNSALPQIPSIALFSYDRSSFGNRVCVWASDELAIVNFWDRCRLLANYLWNIMQKSPRVYHDVPVDLGDGIGYDNVPDNIFCFARKVGMKNPLLPNPYLMRPRKTFAKPLPLDKKRDVLYFRGSSTGDSIYEANRRVALCLAAKSVEGSNCGISHIVHVDDRFSERLRKDGIVRPPDPLSTINKHRFTVDVDGNTSSWDRLFSISSFGSVPIRFECEFEECWHEMLVEGEHFVTADRFNLGSVVEQLRNNLSEAERISTNSTKLVHEQLSPKRIQEWFADAWLSQP